MKLLTLFNSYSKLTLSIGLLLAINLSCLNQLVYADPQPRNTSETLLEFKDAQTKDRYHVLLGQLRCLVCQNQSLADSDAGLAQDLRQKVYEMLQQGASNKEIIAFMVERYGDFVLYNPPLKTSTVLLWFGPFILAGLGILALVIYLIRRNEQKVNTALSAERRRRAVELLSKSRNNR